MGRAQRVKGHTFERMVAIILRRIDPDARRNVEECQVAGLDIKTSLPLGVQCKAFARWHTTIDKVIEQAADACPPGKLPAAIVKIDRKRPLIAMYLDDYFALYEPYLKTLLNKAGDQQT